jgi:hypothetical protein
MPTPSIIYTVNLISANFGPGLEPGTRRGDFVYLLFINAAPQSEIGIRVESQGTEAAMMSLAQKELVAALNGWVAAVGADR